MGNVYKLRDKQSANEMAGIWLARLDRGLVPSEKEELASWLEEDATNRTTLLEMAKMWDEMSSLETLAELLPESPDAPVGNHRPRLIGAAAALCVVGLAGWWGTNLIVSQPGERQETRAVADASRLVYETGVGEQSTTVLSDGSTITLNTDSYLVVRYSAHHRVLELTRGELHVDVATDPRRPLSVVAGENIVQAVGTEFSVQITGTNKAELIVTEGEVLVRSKSSGGSASGSLLPPPPVLPSTAQRVEQGQSLMLGVEDASVSTVTSDEIAARMSWRDGSLMFRGESMEEALRELERYTTIRFVFLDNELKAQGVIGRYKAGDVDAFLEALGASHSVTYTRTNDGRVLLSRL